MRRTKGLIALILVLALAFAAMPITVSAEEVDATYSDYYLQVLANYIDKYGSSAEDGPVISYTTTGSNGWVYYYRLQHRADGVYIILMIDNTVSNNYLLDLIEVRLNDNSPAAYVDFTLAWYYYDEIEDIAAVTGNISKADYKSTDTWNLGIGGYKGYITTTHVNDEFGNALGKVTKYWDSWFYKTLGFSLRNLGFTIFDGKPAGCEHTWTNDCDTTCNKCGATRTITHTYDFDCDPTCNICGATRTANCSYSGNCDAICNLCGSVRAYAVSQHTFSSSSDMTCNTCGFEREAISMSNSYYKSVAEYVNKYGSNGFDGSMYPQIYIADNQNSTYWNMYILSNLGDSLHMSVGIIPYDNTVNKEAVVEITLNPNSTTAETRLYMYDGKTNTYHEEIITITKSTHTKNKTYTVNGGGSFSKSVASSKYHEALNLGLQFFEDYLTEKLGFGVGPLGFTAFGKCSHSYDNACDTTCNLCGAVRTVPHSFGSYTKVDGNNHKRTCTLCGYVETTAHKWDNGVIITKPTEEDPGLRKHTCTDCGATKTVEVPPQANGDLDGDGSINNKDVEYLLWHTLFPDSYPIAGFADFDGNGFVNNKDVEYLLWHTLFPDSYPLIKY